MVRIAAPLTVLAAALALSLPAHAGSLVRTFVSSTGSDSNPCTVAQPCATFNAAYVAVAPGGIVAALDPGKYGPLFINNPVTINGNGWAAITATAQGNGITVNAGTGNVTLIGLEIDGAGGTGNNGIVVNSVGNLTISNCILQNFVASGMGVPAGNGILMQPISGTFNFTITNTTASNNANIGVYYDPPSGSFSANGVIDHVVANANQAVGIAVNTASTSGGTTIVTVSNAITSNNKTAGMSTNNFDSLSTLKVSIDTVTASGNGTGISAGPNANVLLGRSVITGNGTGVSNNTGPGNTLYTYGDNRINLNLNGFDIGGPTGAPNTTFMKQ